MAFAARTSPPEHVHALDVDGLLDPAVTFFSARRGGSLFGVAALKELSDSHGEIKSMHTTDEARRRGVARALLDHLLEVAAKRGYAEVSLETGTMDEFAAARTLYASAGFTECEPFGNYTSNPYSTCMTIVL